MSDPPALQEEREWERAKLRLAYAAETRRFEIERLWQRSLFFWTVLAAAFVGYGVIEGKSRHASLLIACFGLVSSLAWTLQNRGAKYWQEAWEQKTNRWQERVLGVDLFKKKEEVERKGFFGAARYSVSRLAIILSDFTFVIWALILCRSLMVVWIPRDSSQCSCLTFLKRWAAIGAPFAILAIGLGACVVLFRAGRSERDTSA